MTFLRSETNLGFAGGNNMAIERALSDGSRFIFLLNSDAVAFPDASAATRATPASRARCRGGGSDGA